MYFSLNLCHFYLEEGNIIGNFAMSKTNNVDKTIQILIQIQTKLFTKETN